MLPTHQKLILNKIKIIIDLNSEKCIINIWFRLAIKKMKRSGRLVGIYKIRNKITGKVYIGKSVDIFKRWSDHEKSLLKGKHINKYMQKDFNDTGMGLTQLSFEIITLCEEYMLDLLETKYINEYDTCNREIGYNIVEETFDYTEDHLNYVKDYIQKHGVYYSAVYRDVKTGIHTIKQTTNDAFENYKCEMGEKFNPDTLTAILDRGGCIVNDYYNINGYASECKMISILNKRINERNANNSDLEVLEK